MFRKFGVEIECYVLNVDALINILTQHQIPVIYVSPKYKHKVYPCVKLIKDRSLSSHPFLEPIEINLPPSNNFILLEQVCSVLKLINAQCINNCALHIHIDLSDYAWEHCLPIMQYYEDNENWIIQQIIEIQNKTPKLTTSLKGCKWELQIMNTRQAHMNLNQPYQNYKTVEHRAFMGTTNYDEIVKCIQLTQNIVEKGLQYKKGRN